MSADLQNDLHTEIMTEMADNFFSRRRNLEDRLDQFYRLVVRVRGVGMKPWSSGTPCSGCFYATRRPATSLNPWARPPRTSCGTVITSTNFGPCVALWP
jgi:hypothetical protein